MIGTVAENVLAHGTGGLNIDASRVATDELSPRNNKQASTWGTYGSGYVEPSPLGRWPANLIHDGSDEVVGLFPDVGGGTFKGATARKRNNGLGLGSDDQRSGASNAPDAYGDSGSAARFFYCAKASRSERGNGNIHPTVKPLALIKYLITLGLPPGGTVLDPFCGSGTTALACKELGRNYICIEKELEYYQIACNRINQPIEHIPDEPTREIIDNSPLQLNLF